MKDINKTLTARECDYGGYDINIQARATIMKALNQVHFSKNGERLPAVYVVMLSDLVGKLVRLAATPDHEDSIHDIEGYAHLYSAVIAMNKLEEDDEC